MPTASHILRQAAELVDLGWTQGKLARTASHEPTSFSDEDAVKFCPYGAMSRAGHELGNRRRAEVPAHLNAASATSRPELVDSYLQAVKALRTVIGRKTGEEPDSVDIAGWNDALGQTAASVASTLREAAREADATDGRTPPPPGARPEPGPSIWTSLGRMLRPRLHGAG